MLLYFSLIKAKNIKQKNISEHVHCLSACCVEIVWYFPGPRREIYDHPEMRFFFFSPGPREGREFEKQLYQYQACVLGSARMLSTEWRVCVKAVCTSGQIEDTTD